MLHYASTCFEGFKAFRRADGSVHIFRMDRHIQRLQQSTRSWFSAEPDAAQVADMVRAVIKRLPRRRAGSAGRAVPASDYFLADGKYRRGNDHRPPRRCWSCSRSGVGYFAGGAKPLRILVDDQNTRSAQHSGSVKTAGNYAAASRRS